ISDSCASGFAPGVDAVWSAPDGGGGPVGGGPVGGAPAFGGGCPGFGGGVLAPGGPGGAAPGGAAPGGAAGRPGGGRGIPAESGAALRRSGPQSIRRSFTSASGKRRRAGSDSTRFSSGGTVTR